MQNIKIYVTPLNHKALTIPHNNPIESKDFIFELLNNKEIIEVIRKTKKFKTTNLHGWNDGKFNAPKNVGMVMKLINKAKPNSLNDWINYYLDSGLKFEKGEVDPKHYGRTYEYLIKEAYKFSEYTSKKHNIILSFEEAYIYILIRILYETYLGYIREEKTIENLKKALKEPFRVVSSHYKEECGFDIKDEDLDIDYAVDSVVMKDNNPILAVQIKSMRYKGIDIGRNNLKFIRLKEDFGINAMFIYANEVGEIDSDSLDELIRRIEAF